jgi:rhodanese-related sulfurtransferase
MLHNGRYGNLRAPVDWANALLERLGEEGLILPQTRLAPVLVKDGVWLERPSNCRDVLEIRRVDPPDDVLRFLEENGELRLLDVRFGKPAVSDMHVIGGKVNWASVGAGAEAIAMNALKGWALFVTAGRLRGRGFIIGGNTASNDSGIATAFFDRDVDEFTTPLELDDGEDAPIWAGFIARPEDYLLMKHTATFDAVYDIDDDLGISGFENLVDSWFRWKAEEQVQAISAECAYWRGRVDEELYKLRGERFNRVNKPQGRPLIGFMR